MQQVTVSCGTPNRVINSKHALFTPHVQYTHRLGKQGFVNSNAASAKQSTMVDGSPWPSTPQLKHSIDYTGQLYPRTAVLLLSGLCAGPCQKQQTLDQKHSTQMC